MEEPITLEKILAEYDDESKVLCEHEFSSQFRRINLTPGEQIPLTLKAEVLAFEFLEPRGLNNENNTVWGTYFEPGMVSGRKSDNPKTYPPLEEITEEVIEYWKKRAFEAKNLILKARYAGLVWDLSKKITSKSPPFSIGKMYVESLLLIAQRRLAKYEYQAIIKLERGLSLAQSLNNTELISESIDVILEYDKQLASNDKLRLWTPAFDLLISKAPISDSLEQQIILGMEDRLTLTFEENENPGKPRAVELLAVKLAEYYSRKLQKEDVKRVLIKILKAYEIPLSKAPAMRAGIWLESLQKILKRFGLKEEEQEILIRLRKLGPQIEAEMTSIPIEFQIPANKINMIIDGTLTGTTEEILINIASRHIPRRQEIEKHLSVSVETSPTFHHIGRKLSDGMGRTVASIGSIENDLSGNLISQYSKSMRADSALLEVILDAGIKRGCIKEEDVSNFISRCPAFNEDRLMILKKAISEYFENDYLTAIHLIIPQIEHALRNILEAAGGNVLKSTDDGYHLRLLEDVIRDPLMENMLGVDFTTYLRVLLTDSRSWNMRNSVCHGLLDYSMFTSQQADRLIHVLLCFGLLEKVPKDNQPTKP